MNAESSSKLGLTRSQSAVKRSFDILLSALGLLLFSWIVALAWLLARLSTKESGIFAQKRVGRFGNIFCVYKIRTMKSDDSLGTNVTTTHDPRITRIGRVLRRTRIDELPQLFNVLIGDMSVVGPRPDVPGFADRLSGGDKTILSVRPGITGPATLKYRDEEELLASVDDPEAYNSDVIWPDKVRLNRDYVENWSLGKDIRYILATIFRN